jgi:hypothetical protein
MTTAVVGWQDYHPVTGEKCDQLRVATDKPENPLTSRCNSSRS